MLSAVLMQAGAFLGVPRVDLGPYAKVMHPYTPNKINSKKQSRGQVLQRYGIWHIWYYGFTYCYEYVVSLSVRDVHVQKL